MPPKLKGKPKPTAPQLLQKTPNSYNNTLCLNCWNRGLGTSDSTLLMYRL